MGNGPCDNRAGESGVPHLFFDTNSVGEREQADAWFDINQPAFDITVPDRSGKLEARIGAWLVDDTAFTDLQFMPGDKRAHGVRFAPLESEKLVVRYHRVANARGLLNGEPVRFNSGEVHIYPLDSPMEEVSANKAQITAYLPYDRLRFDPYRDPNHRVFVADSPVGMVLRSALTITVEQLSGATPAEARVLSEAFCGMIRALVSRDEDSPPAGRCRFELAQGAAMRSYILENLRDPQLNVSRICRSFAASRATIYREFEQDGGIARFISGQRLQRAYWELACGPTARGRISEVAERYGFPDCGSFSRAFRQKFGTAPTDILGTCDFGNADRPLERPSISGMNTSLVDWISRQ